MFNVKKLIFLLCFLLGFSLSDLCAKNIHVLITGCGRSGTTYISKLLKEAGLDVRHEKLGKDGVVSWYRAGGDYYSYWKKITRAGYERYRHVFHQVRDPIKTISSAQTLLPESWGYIYMCVPEITPDEPLVVRCAKYWYYWNLMAEDMAEWTYRIENIDIRLAEMGKRLGIPVDTSALYTVPKDTRSRNHYYTPLSWDYLEAHLEPELFWNIVALAQRYGYETPYD